MTKRNQLEEWAQKLDKRKLGLLFFGTRWSGGSEMMLSILNSLVQEQAELLELNSCDLDECPNIAKEYHIIELPTILLFRNAQLADRIQGLTPKHELEAHIRSLLDSPSSISNI